MRSIYPELNSYQSEWLDVGGSHSIYVEQSGNPSGIPVLFVHGGPGGGTSPQHRRFFNPLVYRIILFDQRGCGNSRPHGELSANTTQDLIDDMERIRIHLGVENWLLFGGSWGSTLSLAYAQTFPQRLLGLILRGIFLCRPRDIHWFYQEGASFIFPDYWQEFIAPVPLEKRGNMVAAYYELLTSSNEVSRMGAAKAWSIWEARCSTLNPSPQLVDHFADPHIALAMARIEAHYFMNNAFLQPNQLIDQCSIIADIPTWIVHGRYDTVCPVEQAFLLSQALPNARFTVVRDAGHSAFELGITDRLIDFTNQFAQLTA